MYIFKIQSIKFIERLNNVQFGLRALPYWVLVPLAEDILYIVFNSFVVGLTETEGTDQLQQLVAAKEALVSKKDLADDSIGDEDWSVISTQG